MTEYGIWLSFNNQEEGFQLPVNPPAIEIGDGSNSKTYDIGSGEINVIKNRKLTEYSFEGLLPASRYPFVVAPVLFEPRWYVGLILKWMASNRPIRFVFTGSTVDINEAVSIEKFDWKEVGGSPGDIEFQMTLKKYVFYAARKVVVAKASTTAGATAVAKKPPARQDDRKPPKTYTLVAGDNLWKVAQKVLGDGSKYQQIQKLNNLTDAQLKRLPVGMVLKLP